MLSSSRYRPAGMASAMALTAAVGARVFEISPEKFAAATTANFDRLFAKAVAWKGEEPTDATANDRGNDRGSDRGAA